MTPATRIAPFSARGLGFGILIASTLAVFWAPLTTLVRFSFEHEHYSHVILIPLVTAGLLLLERARIFADREANWPIGVELLAAAALLHLFTWNASFATETDRLALTTLALVTAWGGAFVLCYGLRAARQALFPLLFLLLMVPIPESLLDHLVGFLRAGSTEVSDAVLELLGVPFLRFGFVFVFPTFAVEVAEECSGIRSSMGLLVVSLLAGHLFLRAAWLKVVLTLATVPLLIVKNGIRIVTLSLLSMYVDPGFLTVSLHRKGGFVFALVALALLAALLWVLRSSERRSPHGTARLSVRGSTG